jgi:predicted branched-subunit amino acid permease
MSYSNAARAWCAGIKVLLPIAPGVLPFGLVTGVTAVNLGLPPEMVVGMTALFYAGAAQMAALQLLGDGAAAPVILMTVLVINLRLLMYSASLAPYLGPLKRRWKWPLTYMLSDQAYALSILKYSDHSMGAYGHCYFSGVAVSMWLVWMFSVTAGVLLGAQIPPGWSLDFAIPLVFLVLLIPAIRDSSSLAAALVAGTVAVVSFSLPYNLGLLLAAISGIGTGVWVELRLERRADTAGVTEGGR